MGNRPTSLRRAIRRSDTICVRHTLMKADKKAAQVINEDYGSTCPTHSCSRTIGNAMYYAVLRNRTDIVRILIDYGGDVHSTGFTGESCLHCAARSGDVELVRLLIVHGADVYGTDDLGRTPLHSAARSPLDTSSIIRLLASEVGRVGDVNIRDFSGRTPLHEAISSGSIKTAKTLLLLGADAKAQSNLGHTPLYWARASRQRDKFYLMIEHGAGENELGDTSPYDQIITHTV